jgi:hypothetical protein
MLRDLLADTNPTVVANAVAALTEISDRSDDITLKLNITVASKLLAALGECSEYVRPTGNKQTHFNHDAKMGAGLYFGISDVLCASDVSGLRNSRRANIRTIAACELSSCPYLHQGLAIPHELHGQ